jgi:hypothetical protein
MFAPPGAQGDRKIPLPTTRTSVDPDYGVVGRPKLTPDDVKKFEAAECAAQDAN